MDRNWKDAVRRYAQKLGGELLDGGRRLWLTRCDCIIVLNTQDWRHAKDVLKDFDHYFCSAEPETVGRSYVLDMSGPRRHRLNGPPRTFLFPSIIEPWPETRAYLEFARLSPGDVAVDLGAYAGTLSWMMSRQVGPNGHVIAVEPDLENFKVLQANLLDTSGIRRVQAAVSDHDGWEAFSMTGCIGSALVEFSNEGLPINVPAFTLETLLENEIRVEFIKMDIEHAELRVLTQARDFLRRFRPRLVVEPHPTHGIPNLPQVIALLEVIGYQTCLLNQGLKDQPLIGAEFGRSPVVPSGLEFRYSPEWRGTLYDLEGV